MPATVSDALAQPHVAQDGVLYTASKPGAMPFKTKHSMRLPG